MLAIQQLNLVIAKTQIILYNYQNMKILFLILSLLLLTQCRRDDPKHWKLMSGSTAQQHEEKHIGKQLWFNQQIVDHFNYQSSSTWKQRYFIVDQLFNPAVGPVFVYICGQYTCTGVNEQRQWIVTLAQRFQGLILVLEHRYYGESMPFGDDSMKLENMVYLNSEQALSDLAYFLQTMKSSQSHRITSNTPFITIGGSYPGALSAWFRSKYPHLTLGAIASSAVVQAIENFKDFDEQMYSSSMLSGQYCAKAINQSSHKVQQILQSSQGASFKAGFKDADKLSDEQFLFFWIDSIVGLIQYGSRTTLCNNLKDKSADDQFKYFVKLANQTNDVYQYGSVFLSDENNKDYRNSRSWYYQSCSQYGFWQTYSDRHPLRSFKLNIDFYKRLCNNSYGNNLWPKVDRKNIEYGGKNIQAFNLMMVNGVQDPWRWAGLQSSQGNITSRVANCTNCAHCVELYTPSSSDAPELKKIRDQQFLTIMGWIQGHWKTVKAESYNQYLFQKTFLHEV